MSANKKTSCVATSLLDKYATLNNGITSTRTQTAQTQSHLEQMQSSISKLQEERQTMIEQTSSVKQETSTFSTKLCSLQKRKIKLDAIKNEVENELDKRKKECQNIKRLEEKARIEFIDSSKRFREECRFWRLEAAKELKRKMMKKKDRRMHVTNHQRIDGNNVEKDVEDQQNEKEDPLLSQEIRE
eukprot:1262304-Ditylum_brightwellii.AAC.1